MERNLDPTNIIIEQEHPVFRLALSILKNQQEAEDIVQEVLIVLWKKRKLLSEYRSLKAFAMTVTRNLCLNQLTRRQRKNLIPHDPQNNKPSYQPIENNDKLNRVHKIILSLPEDQSTALFLRGVEGFEIDEIANMLKISENNVHVILHRARKRLREEYEKIESYGIKK